MQRRIIAFLVSALLTMPVWAQGLSSGLSTTNPPAIATSGSTAPTTGTLSMGSDGTNAQPLSTTSTGQLIVNTGSGATADQIQGNIASGVTDAGNPVKVGGVFNSSLPTFTNTQRGDVQIDSRGGVFAVIKDFNGTAAAPVAASADGAGSGTVGLSTVNRTLLFNGASWDRQSKPNIFSRIASSSASGSPTNVKATPGNAHGWWGINTLGSNAYLQIYNKASAPVIGTDTPVLTFPIASNSTFNFTVPNGGIYLSAGVSFAFTTDVAATTATAAGTITAFGFIAS